MKCYFVICQEPQKPHTTFAGTGFGLLDFNLLIYSFYTFKHKRKALKKGYYNLCSDNYHNNALGIAT